MIDQAIAELAPVVGTTAACAAVGRTRATHYRWHRKSPPRPRPAPKPPRPQPRALSEEERQGVLEVLRSERFVDMAPPEIYATLLDEGSTWPRCPPCTGSCVQSMRCGSDGGRPSTRRT